MRLHLTSIAALAAAMAAVAVAACSSNDRAAPLENEAAAPDGGSAVDDESETGVSTDARPPVASDVPPAPVQCAVDPCALEIATAGASTCVRLSNKTVCCWGADDYGQLGRGPMDAGQDGIPAPVPGLTGVVQLSAGQDAYCATLEGGSVKCWGRNDVGQLGSIDETGATSSSVPLAVGGLPPVRAAFMGDGIACAALVGGDAMCWGQSSSGRIPDLADAAPGPQPPTKIDLGGRVLDAIAPGTSAIVALAEDGTLISWGKQSRPKLFSVTTLGREASLDPSAPYPLPSPAHAVLLAGWGEVATAVSSGGALRWGALSGASGQVTPTPVTLTTTAKVQGVSIGQGGQFCAVLSDQTARCLGDNAYGQLGTGDYASTQFVPVLVNDLPRTPVRIVTTYSHACAILETGAVMCWGNNTRGELGTGEYALHPSPTPVRLSP